MSTPNKTRPKINRIPIRTLSLEEQKRMAKVSPTLKRLSLDSPKTPKARLASPRLSPRRSPKAILRKRSPSNLTDDKMRRICDSCGSPLLTRTTAKPV